MDYSSIKQQILGQPSIETYLAGLFFVILILLYVRSKKAKSQRDVESERTPEKWNWTFYIVDNFRSIYSTLAICFLLFRFSNPAISYLSDKYLPFIKGDIDLMLWAALIGFLYTYFEDSLEILISKVGESLVEKIKSKTS